MPTNYNEAQRHHLNELCTAHIARKLVRPGDAVLDLGANEGYHTRTLSNLVGPEGIVHAFEPNPKLWANLLTIPNVRLWPMAIGDRVSVETFILPKERNFHQVGSIVDPRDFIGQIEVDKLSIPQVDLDSLLELSDVKISFIKVDIERREYNFVKGAKRVFLNSRPIAVFENNTDEIEQLFSAYDYHVFHMNEGTPLANVAAVPAELSSARGEILISDEDLRTLMDIVEST